MNNSPSVLRLFLDNPEKYYSARDVARELRIGWQTAKDKITDYIIETGIIEESTREGYRGSSVPVFRLSKIRIAKK